MESTYLNLLFKKIYNILENPKTFVALVQSFTNCFPFSQRLSLTQSYESKFAKRNTEIIWFSMLRGGQVMTSSINRRELHKGKLPIIHRHQSPTIFCKHNIFTGPISTFWIWIRCLPKESSISLKTNPIGMPLVRAI